MTDTIRISGIEAFGFHGVLAEEKASGQSFLVDLELSLSLAEAASTDDLRQTVDYGDLAQRVHDLIVGTRYDLIESLAGAIASLILEDRRVQVVEVTVHKPGAPIAVSFGDVSVTVRRP